VAKYDNIKVANKIIVNNIPKDLKDFIKEELYVDNPEYINRVKLKKWIETHQSIDTLIRDRQRKGNFAMTFYRPIRKVFYL